MSRKPKNIVGVLIRSLRGVLPGQRVKCDGWCGRTIDVSNMRPVSGDRWFCYSCLRRYMFPSESGESISDTNPGAPK